LDYIWNMLVGGEPLSETLESFPLSKDMLDRTKKMVNMEQFLMFWADTQRESLSPGRAFEMLTAFHHTDFVPATEETDPDLLTLDDFLGFEISREMWKKLMASVQYNDIFDPQKINIYQDMSLPLSYYYMASSHNTYLEGDQLTSSSSTNR
jgi:hypothetical protein